MSSPNQPPIVHVAVNPNDYPYEHTVPVRHLEEVLRLLAFQLELRLKGSTEFKRPSLGLCVMNPCKPGQGVWLALVAIGPEGLNYIVNGVAKAYDHDVLGQDCGISAKIQPHRMADGSFLYGYSAEVDGTVIGASAQSEIQDRQLAASFAADFNAEIDNIIGQWHELHPDNKWRCNINEPRMAYYDIAAVLLRQVEDAPLNGVDAERQG